MIILFTKKIISSVEADRLIDLYYEGLTTQDDENKLKKFLNQPGLSPRYSAEQALFGYFDRERSGAITLSGSHHFRVIAQVAAGVVVVLLSSVWLFWPQNAGYAWVDGHKTEDIHQVRQMALSSLTEVNNSYELVSQQLDDVSGAEIVQQQLSVFAR